MTKKRFIKLLMAQGKSRNEAQIIATSYNAQNIPYKKAYSYFVIEGFQNSFNAFARAVFKASFAINELRAQFLDKFSTVSTDFSTGGTAANENQD